MAKTITQEEYYQLLGLKALAAEFNRQGDHLAKAVRRITGEEDEQGHSMDFVWSREMDVAELLDNLQIEVES